MEGLLKVSTAVNVTVVMIDATAHIAGKTGLTLTIYATKAAGTPAAITPTVTELDSVNCAGLYKLAFTTTHVNTLGELQLHITGTGADPADYKWQVVTDLPGDTVASVTTVTNLTNAPTAGDLTATMKTSIGTAVAASAVSSVTGNVGGNVTGSVGSVVGAVGTVTGAVGSVTGNVGGNVAGSVGSVTAAVSLTGDLTATMKTSVTTAATAATPIAASVTGAVGSVTGAVGSVTGLTASDVGAIKAKTDNLPALPASTTNITAGVITTVTNLTNAPTSGDLTATMKTSVTTAATAATPTVTVGSVTSVTSPVTLTSDYDAAKTAAQAGNAMTLTGGERDAIANAMLKLDWTGITGEAAHSLLNAFRFPLNDWSIDLTNLLTVYKENGTDVAFTRQLVPSALAQPIISSTAP